MGREKRPARAAAAAAAAAGSRAKDKHKKRHLTIDWTAPVPAGLKARPDVPTTRSKHHSYYELVENKDKKKKLEFQNTNDKNPPPGFEFVPVGNPELTTACKELSREQEAMIFIVSTALHSKAVMSQHIHRIGHHIRESIVEQARAIIGESDELSDDRPDPGEPERIPETQEEIDAQADAAIRDLFPRIPNTDRQLIIEHAFKKGASMKNGEPLVGLAKDIPLSRRVQLAALAHIRHTHTRYDKLLRETSYVNARKAVESVCLDVLVKWRGDEETGRDQIDEILQEIIVISDTEDESEDEEDEKVESDDETDGYFHSATHPGAVVPKRQTKKNGLVQRKRSGKKGPKTQGKPKRPGLRNQPTQAGMAKNEQRGFRRYQAAREARWGAAQDRIRNEETSGVGPSHTTVGSQAFVRPLPQSAPPPVLGGVPMYINHGQNAPMAAPRQVVQHMEPRVLANGHSGRPSDPPELHYLRMGSSGHQRVASGGYRPASVGLDRLASSRTVARPEQLQDYLVPSIEPASPGNNHPSSPIFVRSLSIARTAGPHEDAAVRSVAYARHSPSRGLQEHDEPSKRRRIAYAQREPVRVRPSHDSDHAVMLAERQSNSARPAQPGEIIRYTSSRTPIQERLQQPAAFAVRRQFVDVNGVVLRDEPSRPIMVEDWDSSQPRRVEMLPAEGSHRDRPPPQRDPDVTRIYRGPAYPEHSPPINRRVVRVENIPPANRDVYERIPVEYVQAAENTQRPREVGPPWMSSHHQQIPHLPAAQAPPPARRVPVADTHGYAPQYSPPNPRRAVLLEAPAGSQQQQVRWVSPHPHATIHAPRDAVPRHDSYGALPRQPSYVPTSNRVPGDPHTPQPAIRQSMSRSEIYEVSRPLQPSPRATVMVHGDGPPHQAALPQWQYGER